MKVAIFAACLLSCFVVNNVVSQFIPPFIPPIVPPLGLGLGLGLGLPFGPLGLGLGFGGLLFRRPLLRLALLGGLGKRDVSEVANMLNSTTLNSTICGISSATNKLTCHIVAKNENIDCKIIPRMDKIERLNLTSIDMDVVPVRIGSDDIFRIHSTKENSTNMTFMDEKTSKPVLLSLFQSEKISEQGFQVADKQCWTRFETLLRESNEKSVRVSLFWSQ
jgi:hypothetical protein